MWFEPIYRWVVSMLTGRSPAMIFCEIRPARRLRRR